MPCGLNSSPVFSTGSSVLILPSRVRAKVQRDSGPGHLGRAGSPVFHTIGGVLGSPSFHTTFEISSVFVNRVSGPTAKVTVMG